MRTLAAIAAAFALAVAATGCGSACQDMGARLCRCAPAGTSRDACERQVKDELGRNNPGSGFCENTLSTCSEPPGADFCEWLQTACGKASCGLSNEKIADACAP